MRNLIVAVISIFMVSACSTSQIQSTQAMAPTLEPTAKPTLTDTPKLTPTLTPTTDPILKYLDRLPSKPDGFEWRFVPEVSMAVLIPDGWFYKYEYRDELDFDTFYVTKENIDEVGVFSTGLSVFIFSNTADPDKFSADLLAANVTADTTKRVIGAWDYDAGFAILHILEIEGEFPSASEVNQNKIIHYVSLSYDGKAYFSFFESPSSIWEEAMGDFGAVLLDNLVILDE